MSRLYVDRLQANTTNGDVTLETNLIVSGNLNVTGIFDAHVSDFKVNANSMVLGDASSDIVTINAATASIPNNLSFTTGSIAVGTTTLVAPSGVAKYVLVSDASSAGVSLNDTGGTQWDIYSADSRLHFFASTQGSGIAHRMVIQENGQVGIGTINPAAPSGMAKYLTIEDSSSAGISLSDTGGTQWDIYSADSRLHFFAGSQGVGIAHRMVIQENGNVGIGTINPSTLLEVAGDITVSGAATFAGAATFNGGLSAGDANITNVGDIALDSISSDAGTTINVTLGTDAGDDFIVATDALVVEGDNKNIGVGTTTPTSNAGVSKFIEISDATSAGVVLHDTGGREWTIYNGDGKLYHHSDSSGQVLTLWGSDVGINTATPGKTLDVNGDARIGDDLLLQSDAAVLSFGADDDVSLTHVADTGLLLNGTMKIQFNDASQFIHGSDANTLALGATAEIDLTATSIDINGEVDMSAGLTVASDLTVDTSTLKVDSSNNRVGVGTTSPETALHIQDGSAGTIATTSGALLTLESNEKPKIHFQSPGGYGGSIIFGSPTDNDEGQIDYDHGSDRFLFKTGGNTKMAILGDNVGIGTASPSSLLHVDGDALIGGNLTVSGTTTTVNTANVTVEDPLLLLASGQSGTPSVDAGLIIERGSSTNVTMIWDESEDEFAFATTTSAADTAGNVSIAAYASLQVNALTAGSLDISGDADIDGTLEADAITVNGTTLAEVISDTAGAMFSSNTETGITATYDDSDNTIDLEIAAAQTSITSLLATDIKIGEDDETKIDFETANEIHFYANNIEQVYLADNIFGPQTDSDVDLGTTGVRWKDAYIDTLTLTSNASVGGNLTVTSDLTVNGDASVADDLTLSSDGAIINMGSSNAVTITHNTATTNDGSNNLDGLVINTNDGTTSSTSFPLVLSHTNAGTVAANFGVGLAFSLEGADGDSHAAASISTTTVDPDNGQETYRINFATARNGDTAPTLAATISRSQSSSETALTLFADDVTTTEDFAMLSAGTSGELTVMTFGNSSGNAGDAHVTINPDGDIGLKPKNGDVGMTYGGNNVQGLNFNLANVTNGGGHVMISNGTNGTDIRFGLDAASTSVLELKDGTDHGSGHHSGHEMVQNVQLTSFGTGLHRVTADVDIRAAHSGDNSVIVELTSALKIPAHAIIRTVGAVVKTASNLSTHKVNIQMSATSGTGVDSTISSGTELLGAGSADTSTISTDVAFGGTSEDIDLVNDAKKVSMCTTFVRNGSSDQFLYICNAGTGNGTTNSTSGTLTVVVEYMGMD